MSLFENKFKVLEQSGAFKCLEFEEHEIFKQCYKKKKIKI